MTGKNRHFRDFSQQVLSWAQWFKGPSGELGDNFEKNDENLCRNLPCRLNLGFLDPLAVKTLQGSCDINVLFILRKKQHWK